MILVEIARGVYRQRCAQAHTTPKRSAHREKFRGRREMRSLRVGWSIEDGRGGVSSREGKAAQVSRHHDDTQDQTSPTRAQSAVPPQPSASSCVLRSISPSSSDHHVLMLDDKWRRALDIFFDTMLRSLVCHCR